MPRSYRLPAPCRCRPCPCHDQYATQPDSASASCRHLERALAAEAEVRRLRSLCAAVSELSGAKHSRSKSHAHASGVNTCMSDLADNVLPTKRQRTADCGANSGAEQLTVLKCSDLLYTQNSCKNVFADGTSLEDVVKQLIKRERDPLEDPFFVLDVVEWDGHFYSVDNRRLYCLQRYQSHVKCVKEVWVRVRLRRWHEVFDRFWTHFTTTNGGACIRVRDGASVEQQGDSAS